MRDTRNVKAENTRGRKQRGGGPSMKASGEGKITRRLGEDLPGSAVHHADAVAARFGSAKVHEYED